MKVLITAPANDNHTAPLKWALEQAGIPVACWSGLGWKQEQQASLTLGHEASVSLGSEILEAGDVVWIRRPQQPKPNPDVAEEDRKFAAGEYRWFFHSIMYLLEALPVTCINKYSASRFINNKSVQLMLANECGMLVPRTLMSNSPQAIIEDLSSAPSRTICKAFFPHIWQKNPRSSIAVTETFELTRDMLPDEEVFTYAPAIYQQMVEKRFDVRMVLLGRAVYSYSLNSSTGALDWRQDAGQGLVQVESIATPPDIERAVLAFAERSGIIHGSFDFAVDGDDNWWFLEVNESGQFLWLDDFNSGLHIQEKFLAFLSSPKGATRQAIEEREVLFPSWKDFLGSPAKDQQIPEQADADASYVSIEP